MFWRSQGADDKAVIKIYIHGLGPIAKKGSLGFKPNVKKKIHVILRGVSSELGRGGGGIREKTVKTTNAETNYLLLVHKRKKCLQSPRDCFKSDTFLLGTDSLRQRLRRCAVLGRTELVSHSEKLLDSPEHGWTGPSVIRGTCSPRSTVKHNQRIKIYLT